VDVSSRAGYGRFRAFNDRGEPCQPIETVDVDGDGLVVTNASSTRLGRVGSSTSVRPVHKIEHTRTSTGSKLEHTLARVQFQLFWTVNL
jgi:hypothetical protein